MLKLTQMEHDTSDKLMVDVEPVALLDQPVHKVNQVNTEDQVNQVMLDTQDSLADPQLFVTRQLNPHANLVQMVPMVNPDPLDLPENPVQMVHQVNQVKTECQVLLDHQDHQEAPDQLAQTDHQEMQENPVQAHHQHPEIQDPLEMQDQMEDQERTAVQELTEHQEAQEQRDHQDLLEPQEKMEDPAKTDHQVQLAHKERREFAPNIVPSMEVSSSKMEPDVKQQLFSTNNNYISWNNQKNNKFSSTISIKIINFCIIYITLKYPQFRKWPSSRRKKDL